MKKLFSYTIGFFLIINLNIKASAQGEVQLKGTLSGFGSKATVRVFSYLGDEKAFATCSSGYFNVKFWSGGGDCYKLLVEQENRKTDSVVIYLEEGCISLKWVKGNTYPLFSSCQISGSTKFNNSVAKKTLSNEMNDFFASSKKKSFTNSVISHFIIKHPSSPVSTFILDRFIVEDKIDPNWALIASLYKLLKGHALENILALRLAIKIEQFNTVPTGILAPLFSMYDSSAEKISLRDFRGKYVLLDFWASWCLPCRKENVELLRLSAIYKKAGLQLIGVSLDKNRNDWIKAIKTDKTNWIQLWDGGFLRTPPAKLFHVQAIPSNFLIDRNGKIIGRNIHGKPLEVLLQKIFSKSHLK